VFPPVRAGGRKAWAGETGDFFCCHGTLVQANASPDRGIYYRSGEGPSVAAAQFFDSSLECRVSGVRVTVGQRIDSSVDPEKPVRFGLKIRVPWWAKTEPLLSVNGEKTRPLIRDGWVSVERTWNGDTTAFLYGPVVLAGLCGEEIRLEGDREKPQGFITVFFGFITVIFNRNFWAHSRRAAPGTGLSLQFLDFARQLRCQAKSAVFPLYPLRANAPRLRLKPHSGLALGVLR
jgi:hypothetical protein